MWSCSRALPPLAYYHRHHWPLEAGTVDRARRMFWRSVLYQGSLLVVLAGLVIALAFIALAAYVVTVLNRGSSPARGIAAVLAALAALLA